MSVNSIIKLLSLSDGELLRKCTVTYFQASGPGGQKRNRVNSAVRLNHLQTGITVVSSDSRSAERNRSAALARMRLQLALSPWPCREIDEVKTKFPGKWPEFRVQINHKHGDFPNCVFSALHFFNSFQGEIRTTGKKLGTTSSSLVRFFKVNKQVWKTVAEIRKHFGKSLLK